MRGEIFDPRLFMHRDVRQGSLMIGFLGYLIRRVIAMPITLFIISVIIYGIAFLTPPETRAQLYMPAGGKGDPEHLIQRIIEEQGLRDSFPVQYARWFSDIMHGDWGWSPTMGDGVLPSLTSRLPATAELTLYSVLLLVPMGLVAGVVAGSRADGPSDRAFRAVAYSATSVPAFVLGLVMISVLYAGLHWFPPGRLDPVMALDVRSQGFTHYTWLLTIDGVLNGRLDITLDAARRLVLPVIALALGYWATLGRLTRVSMMEALQQDYVTFARALGVSERKILWRYALKNAIIPPLANTALSAASLITGVYVIEAVFNYPGISEVIRRGMGLTPDVSLALGFSIFSVFLVLPIMFMLDIVQAAADPRMRGGESI
jgi:ABC-type dipeptide/oligopeptide/nickel transport system permease component